MKKSALCILNPAAGKKRAIKPVMDTISNCLHPDYDVDFHLTEAKGDAVRLARENAPRAQLVICGGGDGTLNEVVTGLQQVNGTLPICYIPLGTSNAIARTLKIPKDIRKSIGLLQANRIATHDIGVFNGDIYFNYIAAFGALTAVTYATPQAHKNKLGFLAYLFHFAKHIGRLEPVHAKICADGQTIEGDYILGSISNAPAIAGGVIRLKEQDICFDDGQLELLLVEEIRSKLSFIRMVWNGAFFRRFDRFGVSLNSASNITFEFDQKTAWTVDGEDAGTHRFVSITVKEGALRIYTGLPDGPNSKTCRRDLGKNSDTVP